MRRGVVTSARLHESALQESGFRYRAAFVTLTYRPGREWNRRDVSGFMHKLRGWAKARGIQARAVWVLELTQSGVPHYHAVVFLPRGYTLPMPDKQGWWTAGSSRIEWARKPIGYLVKYTSKGATGGKSMPKGARLWAVTGLVGEAKEVLKWWLAPAWLRAMCAPGDVLRKVAGWWENRTNRIAYRSPWVLSHFSEGAAVFAYFGWTEDDVRFM
jgi:hypothetical protein